MKLYIISILLLMGSFLKAQISPVDSSNLHEVLSYAGNLQLTDNDSSMLIFNECEKVACKLDDSIAIMRIQGY